jgi:hypothetical protein
VLNIAFVPLLSALPECDLPFLFHRAFLGLWLGRLIETTALHSSVEYMFASELGARVG